MPSLLILSASLGVVSRRKSITCIGIGLRLNQKVLKTITCIAEAKVSQLSDLSHLHRVVVATSYVGARLTLSLALRTVTNMGKFAAYLNAALAVGAS